VSALIVGVSQLIFLYNMFRSLRHGEKCGKNPWGATSLEWQTPEVPPKHGNWGPELPTAHRWAYDFSVPGAEEDFIPQNHPVSDQEQTAGEEQHK
jgi:cytochrome c oxidase subunit 1